MSPNPFHPDPHAEVRAFHIEVKSKLVQVAQATLHIEANLTGLRHLMYRHSWFSAFMGVGTNILIFMAIIGVSWTKFRMGGASTTSISTASKRVLILRTWSFIRTFLAFWVLIGSLFIFQGPYFHCFGFIHAKNVNSVCMYTTMVPV